jgi:hypothetical protein
LEGLRGDWLIAGALGASRMSETRTRFRRFRMGAGARLGAGDGPPARGVLGKFTHFAAAHSGLRMGASTVAAIDTGLTNPRGAIGPRGDDEQASSEKQVENEPSGDAVEAIAKGIVRHEGQVSR